MNIYTDGSCLKNPNGPGGWGVLILDKECEWEISGNNPSTTNNIMELQAVIESIKFVTEEHLIIHSDSTYVIKGITEWIENWIKRDWKKVKNSEVQIQNPEFCIIFIIGIIIIIISCIHTS